MKNFLYGIISTLFALIIVIENYLWILNEDVIDYLYQDPNNYWLYTKIAVSMAFCIFSLCYVYLLGKGTSHELKDQSNNETSNNS